MPKVLGHVEAMGENPGPQLFPTKKHELFFFGGKGQKIDDFSPYTVKTYHFTAHTTLEINDKKSEWPLLPLVKSVDAQGNPSSRFGFHSAVDSLKF